MVYNPAMIREDKKLFIPSLLTSKNGIYRYQMKRTCLLIRYAEFQGCHSKKKPKVRISKSSRKPNVQLRQRRSSKPSTR